LRIGIPIEDTYPKKIIFEEKEISLEIIDSAVTAEYRPLLKEFLKSTDLMVLVYDITDKKSFIELEDYYKQYSNVKKLNLIR
jgi:GTPase SAR1 family protein